MTKWTAPDIASIRGDNSRPLQKIFGSLTEYLKDTLSQTTEVSQTYVRNGETTTLTIGTVVYLDAQQGNRATVKRAFNTHNATSSKILGVVAEDIPAHSDGLVTTLGYLEKVNTSAFTAGQTLYLSDIAGQFTATEPHAPNHVVYVGVVVRANAGNGIIYVRCQNGYELDEIHDVLITSPTAGQTLSYDAVTSLWKNVTFSDGGGLTNLNASNLASGTVPTVRISGSYTGITGIGTLTVGSIPATLLTGTVASARMTGSYTNITGLGTLTSLTIDGPLSPSVFFGDWNQNNEWSGIRGTHGYLLTGNSAGSTGVYLRSESTSHPIRIGSNNTNTLTVTNTSATVAGTMAVTGDITRGGVSLPRGIMGYATSTTSQNLSTTSTISTGMTVTFTAETGRLYKITYLEPEVQTASVAGGESAIAIKLTNASGTTYGASILVTPTAAKTENQMTVIVIESFGTAGTKTIVGTQRTNSTTGTPQLQRSATRQAIIMVEDIGAA